MTVPDMAVSGFVVNRQYVRMDAPEDSEFAGFWAEVRQNLTNGERRVLTEALAEIDESSKAARTMLTESAADLSAEEKQTRLAVFTARIEQLDDEVWALVTPHIRAWNAVLMDDEIVEPIPPPAVGGRASIDAITGEMASWLLTALLVAYRSGKGVSRPSRKPGGSPPPTGGPKHANGAAPETSPIRSRRKRSSSPSASTFHA